MSSVDRNELMEGFATQGGGMNALTHPALLPETQYAKGLNVAVRGGFIHTRPGIIRVPAEIPEGYFQGAGTWSLNAGDFLVCVSDGRVVCVQLQGPTVYDLGAKLDPTAFCHFGQVDHFFVIQDGVSPPVILETVSGVPQFREGAHSIPVGYQMIYAHGRLHLVPQKVPNTDVDGRPYIVSGDISEPANPGTALRFEETEYLSEGGAHGLPTELGFIGGVSVFRNAPTGTGVGQVVVFARNGVCAFDFSLPRLLWKAQPLSQVLFFGPGCKSTRGGVTAVNDDLIYRSTDGLRALRHSSTQLASGSGSMSNLPMSNEVTPYLLHDSLTHSSLSHSNNRLYATCMSEGETYRGVVSWDLAAAVLNQVQQARGGYDGIWTGLQFAQIITAAVDGVSKTFVFAPGPKLYVVEESAVLDAGATRIQARVETRGFHFGSVFSRKRLHYVELWAAGMVHDTEIEVFYRPIDYPLWAKLGARTVKVPAGTLPQPARRLRFAVDFPAGVCDPVSSNALWSGVGFQFAIQWKGHMRLERFKAAASPQAETPPDPCDGPGVVLAPSASAGQVLNDFDYVIEES